MTVDDPISAVADYGDLLIENRENGPAAHNGVEVCDVPQIDPERIRRVRARLTDEATAQHLAETFAALADTTRLRIIEALALEELCVCDLSAALSLSQSGTSHHLRTLRNLRLVRHRRAGRLVYYSLDDAHIRRLFDQGLEHVLEGRTTYDERTDSGGQAVRRSGVQAGAHINARTPESLNAAPPTQPRTHTPTQRSSGAQ